MRELSCSSQNFTAVQHTPWDEIFLSGPYRNSLPVDNPRIAALLNDHVFVVIVSMGRRCRGFMASPEGHLAPIYPIEYITLHPGVDWLVLTILFAVCFMNSGKLSMVGKRMLFPATVNACPSVTAKPSVWNRPQWMVSRITGMVEGDRRDAWWATPS